MLRSLAEWRARSAALAQARTSLKLRLAPLLGLGEADALAIEEVACADPGCPDVETVVLVMRSGERTRALRIAKALGSVGEADLLGLAEEERHRREAGEP